MVFACAKKVYSNLPLQAKAEAITWALSLAKSIDVVAMIVESDSKDCVDALTLSGNQVPWRIRGTCNEILNLWSLIPGCHVAWIARGANKAAHSLAKWSFVNNVFGSFDVGFGPSYFEFIIKEEALVSSL